jgi:hypothetical protein
LPSASRVIPPSRRQKLLADSLERIALGRDGFALLAERITAAGDIADDLLGLAPGVGERQTLLQGHAPALTGERTVLHNERFVTGRGHHKAERILPEIGDPFCGHRRVRDECGRQLYAHRLSAF